MRTSTYTTWEERQRLCALAEALGETMLHDEVRIAGGKPANTLVFDWPPLPRAIPPPTDRELRQARIKELLAIPRSDWTTAQLREISQLTAQELIQ